MEGSCCKSGVCGSCEDEGAQGRTMEGKSCCSDKSDAECGGHSCGCCGPAEQVDVKSLGPEAEQMARLFEEVDSHLVSALKIRKEIIETLHKRARESPDMKAKMDKVLASRHPLLLQFVFGQ